jgi:hypothetical protein
MALVLENGVWKLQADSGGSSWEWGLDVDATAIDPGHDFLGATPGSYTSSIGGIDHVLEIPASCTEAALEPSEGFVLGAVGGTLPSSGYTAAPRLSFAIADVFTDYDPDQDQIAFEWVVTNSTSTTWAGSYGWIEEAADSAITDMSGFGHGAGVAYGLDEGVGTTTIVDAAREYTSMLIGPGDSQMRAFKQTTYTSWQDPLSYAADSEFAITPSPRSRYLAIPTNNYPVGSRLCLASTSFTVGNVSTFSHWRVGRLKRS